MSHIFGFSEIPQKSSFGHLGLKISNLLHCFIGWNFVIDNIFLLYACDIVLKQLVTFVAFTNIWFIRIFTDLWAKIVIHITKIFCKEKIMKPSQYLLNKWFSSLKTLLVSESPSSGPVSSSISVQQSSVISSQGEPNEYPCNVHCWNDDPITRPILQASQQSFR